MVRVAGLEGQVRQGIAVRSPDGKTPAERVATRQELSAPLMTELHTWLTAQVGKLSRGQGLSGIPCVGGHNG